MLSFPVEELSRLQLLFKVGVPNGSFAFDVSSTPECVAQQARSGIKVHFCVEATPAGVTLRIWTSPENTSKSMDSISTSNALMSPGLDIIQQEGIAESEYLWGLYSLDAACTDILLGVDSLVSGGEACSVFGFSNHLDPDSEGMMADSTNTNNIDTTENSTLEDSSNVWSPTLTNDPKEIPSPPSASHSASPITSDTSSGSSPTSHESSPPSPSVSSASPRPKFECPEPQCKRMFKHPHTLKVHLKTHKSKPRRVFQCTGGCAAFFSRQHDRLRHEVTQHGRVCEWVCEICSVFFSTSRTLENHRCKGASGTRWVNLSLQDDDR
ncbi:hypothetical protein DFH07DRAFT_765588 [Mycena maculata]|uniref:C2H2-type domain-containing protein n=1 Tax=Mycena maculata TaxID=230809 RepID=A0AAD7KAG0_9AGAR|nr:hypothetical protein DFH07DRAFT_765588 [Mycena maculata]